jgi:transcriptional regulator with XRE-family HTH domain
MVNLRIMNKLRNQPYLIALGKHLKELREEKGLSQEELTWMAGASKNQVTDIECGRINPTASTLYALAKALEIEPMEILNFEFEEPKKKK